MEAASGRARFGLGSRPRSLLIEHLQWAVTAFMFGDRQAEQRVVREKEAFRDIERRFGPML